MLAKPFKFFSIACAAGNSEKAASDSATDQEATGPQSSWAEDTPNTPYRLALFWVINVLAVIGACAVILVFVAIIKGIGIFSTIVGKVRENIAYALVGSIGSTAFI